MTNADKLTRINSLYTFLNMTARSGYVDPQPIIKEIADLLNLKNVVKGVKKNIVWSE